MRCKLWLAVLFLCAAGSATPRPDLKQAEAEPNLEKRSGIALQNAMAALKAARDDYAKGDIDKLKTGLAEIRDSVALAQKSLQQTGKNPRRSPKWFKRAEIETRDLGRRLDSFQSEMSYADRPMLDEVRAYVQQVHEDLLLGLMEGKRK
jgi:hypothetical protein